MKINFLQEPAIAKEERQGEGEVKTTSGGHAIGMSVLLN